MLQQVRNLVRKELELINTWMYDFGHTRYNAVFVGAKPLLDGINKHAYTRRAPGFFIKFETRRNSIPVARVFILTPEMADSVGV